MGGIRLVLLLLLMYGTMLRATSLRATSPTATTTTTTTTSVPSRHHRKINASQMTLAEKRLFAAAWRIYEETHQGSDEEFEQTTLEPSKSTTTKDPSTSPTYTTNIVFKLGAVSSSFEPRYYEWVEFLASNGLPPPSSFNSFYAVKCKGSSDPFDDEVCLNMYNMGKTINVMSQGTRCHAFEDEITQIRPIDSAECNNM